MTPGVIVADVLLYSGNMMGGQGQASSILAYSGVLRLFHLVRSGYLG